MLCYLYPLLTKRVIIEAEASTGEKMAEETLEGKTRRRVEAEARLGVTMEALERADEEAEWREGEEVVRSEEEVDRLEVQRIAAER